MSPLRAKGHPILGMLKEQCLTACGQKDLMPQTNESKEKRNEVQGFPIPAQREQREPQGGEGAKIKIRSFAADENHHYLIRYRRQIFQVFSHHSNSEGHRVASQ